MKYNSWHQSIFTSFTMVYLWVACASAGLAQNGWELLDCGTANHLRAVHFTDADNGWVIQDSPVILHTVDGGDHWISQDTGVQANLKDVSFYDTAVGMATGLDSTLLYTLNGGDDWNIVQTGFAGALHGAQMLSSTMGVAVGISGTFEPQVIYTTDAWQTCTIKSFYFHGQEEGMLTDVEFVSPDSGFAVGFNFIAGNGIIMETRNGGKNWSENFRTPVPEQRLYGIDFVTPDLGFVVGEYGAVIRTEDGGRTWTKLPPLCLTPLWDVSFKNEYIGTVVGESGRVFKTLDGGDSWTQQDLPLYTHYQGVSFIDPNIGYAVGINGTLIKTTDGGGCSLIADSYQLCAGQPSSIGFSLFSGVYNGNRKYLMLAGASGTSPGFPLPGGIATLPLNWDGLTDIVTLCLNTPMFDGFLGTLSSEGIGYAGLNTFDPLPPDTVGLLMHFTYALNHPWNYTSDPVPIEIVP